MNAKPMALNLNVLWIHWSKYEIKQLTTPYGPIDYIVPTAKATAMTYNCAEHAEVLAADALELGRQIYHEASDATQLCLEFAARHGLLGTDVETVPTGVDATGPNLVLPDSREYGEALPTFQYQLMELYQHFMSVYNKEASPFDSHVTELSGLLRYRLIGGPAPQLIWEVQSMDAVIRLAYASLITTEPMPLKICKNCGRIYYNAHAKSEFCSTRCRNYYNVKAFRQQHT